MTVFFFLAKRDVVFCLAKRDSVKRDGVLYLAKCDGFLCLFG